MKRSGHAIWNGAGATGHGKLTTQSGAIADLPYDFKGRFQSEDGKAGTNPEELLGASHAGCFSMAFAFALGGAGFTAEEIKAEAKVEVRPADGGFSITGIELFLAAKVPGIDDATFQQIAAGAKANCPLSKALAAVPISLVATLVS